LVVWKFPLGEVVEMPEGAEILRLGTQGGQPYIWALVDSTAFMRDRRFVVVGTGMPVPDARGSYIGTVLLHDDSFVLHVWEAARVQPVG
jgi:hypothetical protein